MFAIVGCANGVVMLLHVRIAGRMSGFARGRMVDGGRLCDLLAGSGPCGCGEGQREQRSGKWTDDRERHKAFCVQAACQPYFLTREAATVYREGFLCRYSSAV